MGIDPAIDGTDQLGECPVSDSDSTLAVLVSTPDVAVHTSAHPLAWKSDLPTATQLYRQIFGRRRRNASFTQGSCMETSLHLVLQSGYITSDDKSRLLATHVLIAHLDRMRIHLSTYDFRWIRDTDADWKDQVEISSDRSRAMLACLFHYDLDVSLLIRYLGRNYTAAHRDVQHIVRKIAPHVDPDLIPHLIQVMTDGCPNVFNADSTRENSLRYWRAGNNPSIAKHLPAVMKTMNKEERNKFVIPLPGWMWGFIPYLHFTPHHYLLKNDKARMNTFLY